MIRILNISLASLIPPYIAGYALAVILDPENTWSWAKFGLGASVFITIIASVSLVAHWKARP